MLDQVPGELGALAGVGERELGPGLVEDVDALAELRPLPAGQLALQLLCELGLRPLRLDQGDPERSRDREPEPGDAGGEMDDRVDRERRLA